MIHFFYLLLFYKKCNKWRLFNYSNNKLYYVNGIADILLCENNIEILNQGIWKLFDKYKVANIDLISEKSYYKKFNNILAINLLKDNELFCLKYNLYEGCSLCTIANEKIE